jgi:hypothetical protein
METCRVFVRHLGQSFDIGHITRWIANTLAIDRASILVDQFLHILGAISLRETRADSALRENVSQECVRGAIQLRGGNNVIPGFGDIDERVFNRGHSGADTQRVNTAFQRCNPLFQDGIRGVSDARVDVPLDFEVKQSRTVFSTIKLECDRLIDRNGDRFRRGVAVVAGVNGNGFSLHRSIKSQSRLRLLGGRHRARNRNRCRCRCE